MGQLFPNLLLDQALFIKIQENIKSYTSDISFGWTCPFCITHPYIPVLSANKGILNYKNTFTKCVLLTTASKNANMRITEYISCFQQCNPNGLAFLLCSQLTRLLLYLKAQLLLWQPGGIPTTIVQTED